MTGNGRGSRSRLWAAAGTALLALLAGPCVLGCDTLGDIAGAVGAAVPGASQIAGLGAKAVRVAATVQKVAVITAGVAHVSASLLDDKQQSAVGVSTSEDEACSLAQAKLSDNGPCPGGASGRDYRPCTCTSSSGTYICHAAAVYTCVATEAAVAESNGGGPPPEALAMASAAPETVLQGSVYSLGTRSRPGSCMDAQAAGVADGTQIQEWTCNGTGAQSYRVESAGGDQIKLVNINAAKCIDVSNDDVQDGTKIQLWGCNGSLAQSFLVEPNADGFVSIRSARSGKCLDVALNNPDDGTVVQLWGCNGTNAQLWVPVKR